MNIVESDILNDLLQKALREDLLLQAADGEQFVLARVTDTQAFYVGSLQKQVFAKGFLQ